MIRAVISTPCLPSELGRHQRVRQNFGGCDLYTAASAFDINPVIRSWTTGKPSDLSPVTPIEILAGQITEHMIHAPGEVDTVVDTLARQIEMFAQEMEQCLLGFMGEAPSMIDVYIDYGLKVK